MSSGLSKQEPGAAQTIVNVPLAESCFPIAQVAVTSTVAPHGHCLSFGSTAFQAFAPPVGMATVTGSAEQLVVTTTSRTCRRFPRRAARWAESLRDR